MPDTEGDDGAARAYYVRLLPLYMMETRRVQLCMQQKLRYLEIAHRCCAILRLARNIRDSDNEQRNLEIAQIPRLRGTHSHEMPAVIKIIAQLLFDSNLLINNYIFLGPHGC